MQTLWGRRCIAKYILLECEPLDARRMRTFDDKKTGEEEDSGSEYGTREVYGSRYALT